MPLPDAIKIRPIRVSIHARISIPGSKSLTNRSLILAALDHGKTRLQGALWADDTKLMVNALQTLGFQIKVEPDAGNSSNDCNRSITVHGQGGKIPVEKADLDVGAAGTAARFLTAFCALGKGPYRLHGTHRMHERPMKELFDVLRSLKVRVEERNGCLPATIEGPIRIKGEVSVSEDETSQFASALLLISKAAGILVKDPPIPSPYVEMTRGLLKEWEKREENREIEADASSASYFFALRAIRGGDVGISRWISGKSSQLDGVIEADGFWTPLKNYRPGYDIPTISRKNQLGDAALTFVIGAAALKSPLRLIEAGNLRKQECDRIMAMKTELNRCSETEKGEDPVSDPSECELVLRPIEKFKKAEIHTYNDHRIAMCFSLLGAAVDAMGDGSPWLTIKNPSCVEKTFPNFFETMEKAAKQSYEAAGKPYSPVILTVDEKPLF